MTTPTDRRRGRLLRKLRCPGCGAARYLGREGLVCPECDKGPWFADDKLRAQIRADLPDLVHGDVEVEHGP